MLTCLLFGHAWVYPNAEDKARGLPVRCDRCGARKPDLRPDSKHLGATPQHKMVEGPRRRR